MESPDTITVTPWGDLWFCEDGDGGNGVMGITPEGGVYGFANNRVPLPGGDPNTPEFSELAVPTFSPDGSRGDDAPTPEPDAGLEGPGRAGARQLRTWAP